MTDQNMIENIVKQVLSSMGQAPQAAGASKVYNGVSASTLQGGKVGLVAERDYPLASNRPDLIKTPTGKKLNEISLESVLNGGVKSEDVRITPDTLRLQAEVADGVGRVQFAGNLRRAAELTSIPDDRLLEIYNALRPYRSTKKELLEIANELEGVYNAKINAALVREAADVYDRRNRLKAE